MTKDDIAMAGAIGISLMPKEITEKGTYEAMCSLVAFMAQTLDEDIDFIKKKVEEKKHADTENR